MYHAGPMPWRRIVGGLGGFIIAGGPSLYSAWQTAAMSPPPAPAPVIWALAALITLAGTISGAWMTPAAPDLEVARAVIVEILRMATEVMASTGGNAGAAVLLPKGATLCPVFTYNKAGKPDAGLCYRRGAGSP